MAFRYTAYRSPLGITYLVADSKGLVAVSLNEPLAEFRQNYASRAPGDWQKIEPQKDPILMKAVQALEAYFKEGKPFPSDLPLNFKGSPFQMKVWKALRRIPFGKTVSYGEIAAKVGSPQAARAVGGACGSNPLPLFIPCHRVLAGDGGLGGFGGGLDMKRKLLKIEGVKK